jgi:hypothetical protein
VADCGFGWLVKTLPITPLIGFKIDQTTALYLFKWLIAVARDQQNSGVLFFLVAINVCGLNYGH